MGKLTVSDVRAVPGDSAFLIDDGKTAILYDTGFGFNGQAIAAKIKNLLGDCSLAYILLSHTHYDHCLASSYIKKVYPEAKIIAHKYAQHVLSRPSAISTMRKLDRTVAQKYGISDYEDLTHDLHIDIPVEDGDMILCGDRKILVIGLPGHTKCSIGFYITEEKLLLGTETLGVYFGNGIYLPSFLVSYAQTLNAYEKVRKLQIDRMLLPHYGIVDSSESQKYLNSCESISRKVAKTITDKILAGLTHDEIILELTELLYNRSVSETYPYEAFRLNSDYMIELIRKECT